MNKFLTVAALASTALVTVPASADPIRYNLTGLFSGSVNGTSFTNAAASFVGIGDTAGGFTAQDANFVPLSSLTFTTGGNSYTVAPGINFWSSQSVGSSGFKYFPSPDVYAFRGLGTYDNNSSLAATPVNGYFFGNFGTTGGGTVSLSGSSNTQFSAQVGAVPEPATWAMMLVGFGAVGGTMRRRKSRVTTRVAFA